MFADGITFNPREPYGGNPFVAEDSLTANALTGAVLPVSGTLAVMCHRAAASDHVLALAARAGFPCEPTIMRFDTECEYLALLRGQAAGSVLFQHAHPSDAVSPLLSRVPHHVLTFLNDKANLEALVPASAVPRRRVISPAQIARPDQQLRAPVVLKVSSDHSLGSGEGVRICRNSADIQRALGDFAAARCLIAEEFLELHENWCVQYACLSPGHVRYLGSAEQLVDERGQYLGTWIGDKEPPDVVMSLGCEIARRGSVAGYVGIAGFDIAVTASGRAVVLDLNFRINGSTVGLLYRESIFDRYGHRDILVRGLRSRKSWQHLFLALSAPADGLVLPYAGYDQAGAGGTARASVLMVAPSRDEAMMVYGTLRRRGLT